MLHRNLNGHTKITQRKTGLYIHVEATQINYGRLPQVEIHAMEALIGAYQPGCLREAEGDLLVGVTRATHQSIDAMSTPTAKQSNSIVHTRAAK